MTIFPNAKINIGLFVTGKRKDGYHNIESLFYPVGARDALEFVIQTSGIDSDELTITGLSAACKMKDNMVIKAVNLLRKNFAIPPLKIHLHKSVPPGSGLGAGSSDAAFMLRYLNRYFDLGLSMDDLKRLSLQLGSDCAFFVDNKPSVVKGRGEILEKTDIDLGSYSILIINPGIHISTAEAYSLIQPGQDRPGIEQIIKLPVNDWSGKLKNDFTGPIIKRYPLIGKLIDDLYNAGSIYSSMSGSGSSVFGIFENIPETKKWNNYWRWSGAMQSF